MLTGQLFMRNMGEAPSQDGRKLFIVCGIVAVPPEQAWQGEAQYTVTGGDSTFLVVHPGPIDRTELARGRTPTGLLLEPIWRV